MPTPSEALQDQVGKYRDAFLLYVTFLKHEKNGIPDAELFKDPLADRLIQFGELVKIKPLNDKMYALNWIIGSKIPKEEDECWRIFEKNQKMYHEAWKLATEDIRAIEITPIATRKSQSEAFELWHSQLILHADDPLR